MSQEKSAAQAQFHKTRWLYKKDGRDVGPFRPHEFKDLLLKREVSGTTPVRDLTTPDWKPLGQITGFTEILTSIEHQLENAAQERRFDRQLAGRERRRTLPLLVLGLVLLAGLGALGLYGWQRYQTASAQVPSGIATDLVRQLELDPLPERAYLNTAGPIQWAAESVKVREAKANAAPTAEKPKRRPVARSAAPSEPRAVGSDDLAEEPEGEAVEMDLSAPDTGRELGPGEFAMVRQSAVNKLVACAQAEAERSDGFAGTTVQFALQPSGKVGNIRLGKNGGDSASFAGCVRGALGQISVEPFGGTAQVVKVPLNVGR